LEKRSQKGMREKMGHKGAKAQRRREWNFGRQKE